MNFYFAGPVDLLNCDPSFFTFECMTFNGFMFAILLTVIFIAYAVLVLLLSKVGHMKRPSKKRYWLGYTFMVVIILIFWFGWIKFSANRLNGKYEKVETCARERSGSTPEDNSSAYQIAHLNCFDEEFSNGRP